MTLERNLRGIYGNGGQSRSKEPKKQRKETSYQDRLAEIYKEPSVNAHKRKVRCAIRGVHTRRATPKQIKDHLTGQSDPNQDPRSIGARARFR